MRQITIYGDREQIKTWDKLMAKASKASISEMILSCNGNLTAKSTAKIFGVATSTITRRWKKAGLKAVPKNFHRTQKGFYYL